MSSLKEECRKQLSSHSFRPGFCWRLSQCWQLYDQQGQILNRGFRVWGGGLKVAVLPPYSSLPSPLPPSTSNDFMSANWPRSSLQIQRRKHEAMQSNPMPQASYYWVLQGSRALILRSVEALGNINRRTPYRDLASIAELIERPKYCSCQCGSVGFLFVVLL